MVLQLRHNYHSKEYMIDAKIVLNLKPLEGLKKSLINKILRKAVSEASKNVKLAVKANAGNGNMGKSIGIKVKTYKSSVVAVVGPRTKYQKANGVFKKGKKKGEPKIIRPSKIAHLVEKGTKRSKARPFLKPAYDSTHQDYLTNLAQAIERGINKQLAKS